MAVPWMVLTIEVWTILITPHLLFHNPLQIALEAYFDTPVINHITYQLYLDKY